ncbi:MAG: GNAT family N-acetyltransferase [Spirochaetota bacterium]
MALSDRYSVRQLTGADIAACMRLLAETPGSSVPVSPSVRADAARRFLSSHVKAGAAVGAFDSGGDLAGYVAFDSFDFHGERTGFCPLSGHAARPACAADVYERLYTSLSERWVADGVRKHLVSVPASQPDVERRFCDLGFGRYVVDAYMPIDEHAVSPAGARGAETASRLAVGFSLRTATRTDAAELNELLAESVGWYAAAPIFLRVDAATNEETDELLSRADAAVFFAERDGHAVGFMGVQLVDRPNPVALTVPGDATLDGIGAYLQPGARCKGLGEMLLRRCRDWAAGHGASLLHVDYESANPAARAFWPKHFVPGAYSLLRHTHADMQETQ